VAPPDTTLGPDEDGRTADWPVRTAIQSRAFWKTRTSRNGLAMCSIKMKRPPGRRTGLTSLTAFRSSGIEHSDSVEITVSTLSSGMSRACASPTWRSAWWPRASALCCAIAIILGLTSMPSSWIPGGEYSRLRPVPTAISSTTPPACEHAQDRPPENSIRSKNLMSFSYRGASLSQMPRTRSVSLVIPDIVTPSVAA